MIIKAVVLFLILIGVLAMFGKLHVIAPKSIRTRKCRKCGKFQIGRTKCSCNQR
jgi:hypothetical protein